MKFSIFNFQFSNKGIDLIKYRKWWYLLSLIIIIPGLISLSVYRLRPSIDFTGGTLIEIDGTKDKAAIQNLANKDKLQNVEITQTGTGLLVRSAPLSESLHNQFKTDFTKIKGVTEAQVSTVGPTISQEITRNAFFSVILASLVIIFYIAYSFRKVPKPANSWEFGITAVIALLHDALVVLGVFSILGHFYHVEVDPLFITALLTVIGFSVHDTIVIFDRIRENLIKQTGETFEQVVNRSVIEMLPRDLNTSFLVWAILLVLYIFGGVTTRYFVLALIVGIFSGTFSSILNASPLLVTWQEHKKKKLKLKNEGSR